MFGEIDRPLVIALSKGRPLVAQLDLLAKLGITPGEDIGKSRKLVFPCNHPKVSLMVLRGHDVAHLLADELLLRRRRVARLLELVLPLLREADREEPHHVPVL